MFMADTFLLIMVASAGTIVCLVTREVAKRNR
jgi:hypothetical protein